MKKCAKCGELKCEDAFGARKGSPDGLSAACRICHNAAAATWRKLNPEKVGAANRRYREDNPDKRAGLKGDNVAEDIAKAMTYKRFREEA